MSSGESIAAMHPVEMGAAVPPAEAHGTSGHTASEDKSHGASGHGEAKPAQPQRSFVDRIRGKTPEPPKPTPSPTERPTLSQADTFHGGSTKQEVKFDQKTLDDLENVITARLQVINNAQGRGVEPSDFDKILLSSGLVDKVKNKTITRDDYMTALALVNSEVLEKSAMIGIIGPRDSKTSKPEGSDWPILSELPGWSTLVKKTTDPSENPLTLNVPGTKDGKVYVASQYAQELSHTPTPQEIMDLESLRMRLIEASFGKGAKDPLFDSVNTSLYPTRLINSRHYLYGEIGKQVQNIIGSEFPPGTTIEQVWKFDRPKMAEILIRANQEALKNVVRSRAESILREPAGISLEAIKARADELREKPKPEELIPLEAEKTKADAALAEAQQKLAELKTEIPDAEKKVREKQAEKNRFDDTYEGEKAALEEEIERLERESQIALDKLMSQQAAVVTVEKNQTVVNPADNQERTYQTILKEIKEQKAALRKLFADKSNIDQSVIDAQEDLDRLKGVELEAEVPATDTTPAKPAKYSAIRDAEEVVRQAQEAANTAKGNVDAKQKEIDGKSVAPEKEMKAKEIELWGTSYEHISDIRANMMRQTASDPYSFKNLKDTTVSADGRIAGYDKLREAIFYAVDPKAGLNPAQYESMLSNEALASIILRVYGIKTSTLTGIRSGLAMDRLISAVNNHDLRIQDLEATASTYMLTPEEQTELIDRKRDREDSSKEILQTALSQIDERKRTIKLAHLAHEIITRGALQAQRGESRLRIT